MFHMSKKCDKNTSETFDLVFYFYLGTSFLRNMFELENIYLTCSALVYSFFLQITRNSFIKVFPFKYAFAKGAGEN